MDAKTYHKRWNKLAQKIEEGLVILLANPNAYKNVHIEFRFRQDSHFWYLTGIDEPLSVLLLEVSKSRVQYSALFMQPKNSDEEHWSGRRLGPVEGKKQLQTSEGFSLSELDQQLAKRKSSFSKVFIDPQAFHPRREELMKTLWHLIKSQRELKAQGIHDLKIPLGEIRKIKEEGEIDLMRQANQIGKEAHEMLWAYTRPGIHEYELEGLLLGHFRKRGARGEAYQSIVASGENALILHYVKNHSLLKDGDLVLVDAGPEFEYYSADITRTYPVSGKFRPKQIEIYQAVLMAQEKAIDMVAPGKTLQEVHEVAARSLTQSLIDLKILKGSVEENYSQQNFKKYYTHATSHWLGLDTHDSGKYSDVHSNPVPLEKGMVFTVEPGLYFREGPFQGIGIRIEDNILVTDQGYENLTQNLAKQMGQIEEICTQDFDSLLRSYNR